MAWLLIGRDEKVESLMESPLAAWQAVIGDKEMSWVQVGPRHYGEMYNWLRGGAPQY